MGIEFHIPNEYPNEPRLKDLPFNLINLPRWLLLGLIRLYQKYISPAAPPTCRFYPSCSHYGYQSIYKFGAIRGAIMAFWRILRCNPFNAGGYDPVPDQFKDAFCAVHSSDCCSEDHTS